jgi:hypothetical protein
MNVNVVVGNKTLTFSPLNLKQIRALTETFKVISNGTVTGLEAMLALLPHLYDSVHKVHQDLTFEQFEELLTYPDFAPAQRAMLEASGMKAAAVDATTEGEAKPVAAA